MQKLAAALLLSVVLVLTAAAQDVEWKDAEVVRALASLKRVCVISLGDSDPESIDARTESGKKARAELEDWARKNGLEPVECLFGKTDSGEEAVLLAGGRTSSTEYTGRSSVYVTGSNGRYSVDVFPRYRTSSSVMVGLQSRTLTREMFGKPVGEMLFLAQASSAKAGLERLAKAIQKARVKVRKQSVGR